MELSNPPSVRVLEKAGFQRAATDAEENTAQYRIAAPADRAATS
ncbi:hypothetical protein [Actinomadura xylanilytica]|nr:hypothetical protein [Actinomadura xylanilytica]MDL4775513.1 hypothetical protein [Actinomadura xylanilytica]